MERPLLYPLDEAGLQARPAPVACAASDTPPRWRAPAQADEALQPMALATPEDAPEEEEGPDAMPTGQMPRPVSVPLDENPFAPRRRVWPWALGAAALLLLGCWIFLSIG